MWESADSGNRRVEPRQGVPGKKGKGYRRPGQEQRRPEDTRQRPGLAVSHEFYGQGDQRVGEFFVIRPLAPQHDHRTGGDQQNRDDEGGPPEEGREPEVPVRGLTGSEPYGIF